MLLQFIINGLITGILYSLSAIGFALVYNTTRIFHIAAAALFVIAAYTFYYFCNVLGLSLPIGTTAAMTVTAIFSVGIDLVIYIPFYNKKSSLYVMMIASIGVMTVLVNLVSMLFGNETKIIDNSIQKIYTFGKIIITTPQMLQIVVGSVAIIGFMLFLKFGLQTRAFSSNDNLFRTMGYSGKGLLLKVFGLSGLFFALASSLTVYDIGLNPHMGMNILINAMVAMIVGGTGRFSACILGGLTLGILQSLAVYQFASNWQNAITFLVLILFLFLRPQGFIGYKKRLV